MQELIIRCEGRKIRSLEERLRLELIRKYGPQSETLNDAQLLLLDLEPGVSAAEVEAESNREPLPPARPAEHSMFRLARDSVGGAV